MTIDTSSHVSDIPLQLPAGAHVPSNNSALVTFSQAAGSDPVPNVQSLQPIRHQISVNPWQILYPVTYPQSVPAVLGPQAVQLVTQQAGEALNNKEKFLLPLINMKRLQGKTSSIFWQDVTKHAITSCKCNSNTKQTHDFPKDKGNCYRDTQKAYQAHENQREGSDIVSMETRRASIRATHRT